MIAGSILLLVVVAAVGIMLFGHADGGYALLAWGNWTVETSLIVLVLGIVLAVAVLYGVTHLGGAALRLPGQLRDRLQQRRRERARKSFDTGLLRLLQGDWKRAELELLRHAADREAPQLNYLAAARAAQYLGASGRRDHYLDLAADTATHRDLKLAALTTRAELQRERGEYPALLETARALRREDLDNPYALQLLAEALADRGQWDELSALLAEPAARVLEPVVRDPLRLRALLARIHDAAERGSLDDLKRLWRDADDLARNPEARVAYTQALLRVGDDTDALGAITKTLDRDWNAELAGLFAQVAHTDAMTRLASAEVWLQRYGERAQLLAAAGGICIELRLWGKAQSYLETLLRIAPSAKVYRDLARLAEATQHPEEAARYYQQGLMLAVEGVRPAGKRAEPVSAQPASTQSLSTQPLSAKEH